MGGKGKPKWNLWKGRGGKRNKGERKKAKNEQKRGTTDWGLTALPAQ